MGMLSGDIDMKDACSIISNEKKKYPNFGGVLLVNIVMLHQIQNVMKNGLNKYTMQ